MRSDHLIGNASHLKSNDTLNQIKAAAQCDEPTSKLIKFVKECCTAANSAELANSSARWSNSIRWPRRLVSMAWPDLDRTVALGFVYHRRLRLGGHRAGRMPARPDARAWGRRNIQPSAPVNAGYYNIQPDQPFTGPADRLDDRSANGLLSRNGRGYGEEERKIIRLVCPREG
jgi:hypothetical protein